MAEEQDIKIKIATEANTAGAKQAENALKDVEQQAKKTEAASGGMTPPPMGPPREQVEAIKQVTTAKKEQAEWEINAAEDVAKAKEMLAGRTADAAKKGQVAETAANVAAKLGYGESAEAFAKYGKVVGSGATAVLGSLTAIAAAADWASDALTKTFDGYTEAIAYAKANGLEVDPGFEADIKAQKEMIYLLLEPVLEIKDAWAALQEAFSNPEDYFSGLSAYREGIEREVAAAKALADQTAAVAKQRLDSSQKNLELQISRENEELDFQLSLVKQINAARNQSDDVAVARAQNQVKIAEQDGGDVAAAEANVLLVSLKADLDTLRRGLGETRQKAAAAKDKLDDAKDKLDDAIAKGASEDQINQLDQIAIDKKNAYVLLDKQVKSEVALISEKATLFAESAEIAVVDLQDKYKGSLSKAAQEGIAAVQAKIKEVAAAPEVSTQADAVVNQFKETAAVTTQKLGDVAASMTPISTAQQQSIAEVKASIEKEGQVAQLLQSGFQGSNQNQDKVLEVLRQVIADNSVRDRTISNLFSQVQAQAKTIQEMAAQTSQ